MIQVIPTSMRAAMRQMVADRATAKRIWGKGSLVELMIKVACNSCYGKLAQDVVGRLSDRVLLIRPGRVGAVVEELQKMGHTPQVNAG